MIPSTCDVFPKSLWHSGVGCDAAREVDAPDSQPDRDPRHFLQRHHVLLVVSGCQLEFSDFKHLRSLPGLWMQQSLFFDIPQFGIDLVSSEAEWY